MKPQSKKYKKYLTGVASAALVASAVAPAVSAASFSDVVDTNSHKEAIDALSEAGVISGYPDGTFQPNKTLTRSDVVKLMGKWLVSMGYEIPKDYKTNPRFTDLTSKSNDELLQSAAIVRDNNVFKGKEDGSLDAAGNITRENMAIVLVRAYSAVHNVDLLTYVQEQEFDRDVVDLNKAKAEARTAIDVLDYFDITNPAAPNFRPKETTTRAQFASFLYKTANVEKPGGEEPEAPEVSEITSVNPTSEKELELQGKNLHLLKADQLAIEGNEIASFTANKEGTQAVIELKNELVSGKEMALTLTTKDEDDKDQVETFKFTYELTVGKVEATTTKVEVNKENQQLMFNVDGKPADLQKLKDAGYTVVFQATKTGYITDAANGTLKKFEAEDDFSYKVIVSKDGKSVESDLVKVNVLDYSATIANISKVEVVQNGVTVESGKLSLDESGDVNVKVLKYEKLNGETVTDTDEDPITATFTSSNPSVATVTSAGKVTPISPGEVNIVANVDGVTKNIPLTVVTGKRTASTVTVDASSVKLLKDKTQPVNIMVKDQFGDPFTGKLTAETKDASIATATLPDASKGEATLTVKGEKAGTTDIQIKAGDTVLSTISVAVSEDAQVTATKLEPVSAGDNLTIDSMKGSSDNTVELAWKQYNSQGFYVGNDLIKIDTYTTSSTNTDVATVDKDENGIITVTAKSAGTADIVIKQGDVTKASATITVVDSTPSISSVNFEKTEPVITTGAFTQQVLKPEGIKLTSTEFTPEIKGGKIVIDSGSGDIELGTVAQSYSGDTTDISDLTLTGGQISGTAKPEAQGTIVVSVKKNGQTAPVGTHSIQVNVPAAPAN